MLQALHIKNVVLIDQLSIDFAPGFSTLTGETGAGKSILLDSLGMALGARADSGIVRKGADQAQVTAEFSLPSAHPAFALLKEQGLDAEMPLVLRRIIGADGRSRAFINDQPVSIGLLRQVGLLLVEVHGQFDTVGLLDPATHRALLDGYAGVTDKKIAALWQAWKDARTAYDDAVAAAARAKADEEYLRHAVKELEELAPHAGEEEQLLIRREVMKHGARLKEAFDKSWDYISGDDGAEMAIGRASRLLEGIADKSPRDLGGAINALARAGQELQEAIGAVQTAMNLLDEGGASAEEIEDRLYALRGLARKYHCTPDDLVACFEDMSRTLSLITRQDDILAGLSSAVIKARKDWEVEARTLQVQRRKAAEELDALVMKELAPLKLDKARFSTLVETLPEDQWGPGGMDRVQFMVATNPGAEPGPLHKIASGGEMARFMLALKVVMAEVGTAQTLVFDEVDTGIGGATASAVGERLARLAKKRQVLVVTHAPQVAARAGHHLIVMKQGQKDVRTTVMPLEGLDMRREEIARMLSGAEITREARAAAGKLLETGS